LSSKQTRNKSFENKTKSKKTISKTHRETHIVFRIIAILLGLVLIASGISFYIEKISTRSGIEMIFHLGTSFLVFGILSLIGGIRGRVGIEKERSTKQVNGQEEE
jgi:NhaP-type Na+/H+ and K+/H+ antiporter